MKYETETIRKVYDHEHGVHITVAPDCDGLGLLEIDGKDDFGGPIRLDPEMAITLADAISVTAREMIDAALKS